MSIPKKHHYVPQFLLRNFADTNGQVQVHRADVERRYRASVRDLGHRNFGHSLFWPNREPDHASLETRMTSIEGAAASVVTELRSNRTRSTTVDQRETLGFLIALQWARSRFLLMVVRRDILGRDTPAEGPNRSLGLLNIITSVLEPWAARQRGEFDPKERFCAIADQLDSWSWHVYRPTGPKLIISDNIVSMWGVAEGKAALAPEAWTRHGVGVGFGNCARITVPLAPDLGLVLTPPGQAHRGISAAAFNRATIYNSREFVAHHPASLPDQLQQSLAEDLGIQRWILPTILEGSTT